MLVIDFVEIYEPNTLQILVDSHLINIDFQMFGCSKLLKLVAHEPAELLSYNSDFKHLIIKL